MSKIKTKCNYIQYCVICGKRLNYLRKDKDGCFTAIFPRYQLKILEKTTYSYNGRVLGYICNECLEYEILRRVKICLK